MVNSFIVWYLFLAGTGSGAFLVGAVIDILRRFRNDAWLVRVEPVAEGGLFLGPVVVMIGGVFLLADLGSPERAFQVFFTASASLLTLGSWSIALFCVCAGGALAVGSMADTTAARVGEAVLHTLATASACFVMVYSGLYLSTFPTIPFLHSPLVPLVFVASALSTGIALLLLFGFVRQDQEEVRAGVSTLVRIDIAALVLEIACLGAFVARSLAAGGPLASSAETLLTGEYAGLFLLGAVTVGLVVPLAIEIAHLVRSESHAFAIGAVCSLAGGLCLRYALLLATVRFNAIDMSGVTFWG